MLHMFSHICLQVFFMCICKCFRHMFRMFQLFRTYVASVSEACCKSLFKMFHLFPDVCCNHFDLDVAYVFTHILQQYIPKYFICFSLLLQQVFSCCKCFYLDGAYIFTHMLQVYVLNVSPVLDICCKCFIWMLHMLQ